MAKNILTAVFSASGVTENVGREIAKIAGGDFFEIEPVEPYTEKDLKWTNPLARCNKEKIGRKDVPISGKVENMADYDTLYVGFPIRYYAEKMHEIDADMPMILEHLNTDDEYIKYMGYLKEELNGLYKTV